MAAKYRILIVDDDPNQRKRLGETLATHFEVIAARSGKDGLKKLSVVEPDAVIVTRQIPDMDADEFLDTMRAIRDYRDTLVLFTSERAQHESIDPDKPVAYLTASNADAQEVAISLAGEIQRRGLVPRRKSATLEELRESAAHGSAASADTVPDALEETAPHAGSASRPPLTAPRSPMTHATHMSPSAPGPASASRPVLAPQRRQDGKARILVVDDEPDIQTLYRIALTPQHRVYTAGNGLDAMKQAQLYRPDLFIVDWMMPMVSGPQLIRMLRQSPIFERTPVIVVSAKTQIPQKHALDQLGVNAYMSKPVNMDELELEIERELMDGEVKPAQRPASPPSAPSTHWI